MLVLAFLNLLVILQGIFSYLDGYLTQRQLKRNGVVGYSFLEHGGMWGDFFLTSPAVAMVGTKYAYSYWSARGLLYLCISTVFTFAMGYAYNNIDLKPEAHTHHGKTTAAGWVHGLYAAVTLWVFMMFYLSPIATPKVSVLDTMLVSFSVSALFVLGIKKFNPAWCFIWRDYIQIGISWTIVWGVTAYRVWALQK